MCHEAWFGADNDTECVNRGGVGCGGWTEVVTYCVTRGGVGCGGGADDVT